MNKVILTNFQETETIVDKEYFRVSSKPDGIAVMLKGNFDSTVNSLETNRLFQLSIYSDDTLIIKQVVKFVSYNFLLTVADDNKSMAIIDNTALFSIMK